MPWTFCGSAIATQSVSPSNAYGTAVTCSQDAQRHRLRGDQDRFPISLKLDDGKPVLGGDEPRDGLARRKFLVDQHLDDREVLRLLPDGGELGLGDEPGRLEQVDDQLAHELRDRGGSGGPRTGGPPSWLTALPVQTPQSPHVRWWR